MSQLVKKSVRLVPESFRVVQYLYEVGLDALRTPLNTRHYVENRDEVQPVVLQTDS